MRAIWTLIILTPLALLAASHFGAIHPLGDSLAVFRGPLSLIAAGALFSLLAMRRWRLFLGATALVLWSGYSVLMPRLGGQMASNAPYSLYQKNMLFRMPSIQPLVADILSNRPDFITLQEVSKRNAPVLPALKPQYPAQVSCRFAGIGSVAVLSRWPMIDKKLHCEARRGVVAMQVKTPDGPLWLVSLHLHWPYPHGQAEQLKYLLPFLEKLNGPVVLGGDFNMVPWSHTMRAIGKATGTRRIGAVKDTFVFRGGQYTLALDHVLVNENNQPAQITLRPLLGSDHHGLLARFSIR